MEILTILVVGLVSLANALILWMILGRLWWQSLKDFFHKSYSFFDVSFVIAYFIEQIILTLLIYWKPAYSPLWAGLMSITVVTTASLQKLASESRIKRIRDGILKEKSYKESYKIDNEKLLSENKVLQENIKNMKKFIEELVKELKLLDKENQRLKKRK
jgi:hypothetical protein